MTENDGQGRSERAGADPRCISIVEVQKLNIELVSLRKALLQAVRNSEHKEEIRIKARIEFIVNSVRRQQKIPEIL